jgi:hypothetical protein
MIKCTIYTFLFPLNISSGDIYMYILISLIDNIKSGTLESSIKKI